MILYESYSSGQERIPRKNQPWLFCVISLNSLRSFFRRAGVGVGSVLIKVYGWNPPVEDQSATSSDDIDNHQEPIPVSVVEHLTVLSAVTVTSMSTVSPPSSSTSNIIYDGSLLESTFPVAATARIHICLSPGREYAPAMRAFQAHCEKVSWVSWF